MHHLNEETIVEVLHLDIEEASDIKYVANLKETLDLLFSDEHAPTYISDFLIQCYKYGPMADGDCCSKSGRDFLVAEGYAEKVIVRGEDGYQALNYKGRDLYKLYCKAVDLNKEKKELENFSFSGEVVTMEHFKEYYQKVFASKNNVVYTCMFNVLGDTEQLAAANDFIREFSGSDPEHLEPTIDKDGVYPQTKARNIRKHAMRESKCLYLTHSLGNSIETDYINFAAAALWFSPINAEVDVVFSFMKLKDGQTVVRLDKLRGYNVDVNNSKIGKVLFVYDRVTDVS